MGTRRVNVQLPDELLEKATIVAMTTDRNRTEIVAEALREYLKDFEHDEKFKEDLIEGYFDDEIGFDSLAEFVVREDAEAVRSSKSILEQGEKIADNLDDL